MIARLSKRIVTMTIYNANTPLSLGQLTEPTNEEGNYSTLQHSTVSSSHLVDVNNKNMTSPSGTYNRSYSENNVIDARM